MIKKLVTNILLIALVLNLSAVFSFAQETEGSDYRLQTLSGLGIIPESVDPEGFVTRGEFINTAVRLRNASAGELSTPPFEDISSDYEYYRSIEAAVQYGLIKGDGKRINAGSIITAEQVKTILFRVLGYVDLDEKGINAAAKKINKLYIPAGNADMTWGTVIKAVYDVLDKETVTQTLSKGKVNYETTGKLLLEDYHDIYTEEGVVDGVGEALLTGEAETGKGLATINGKQYRCYDAKMRSLIGRRVKFYYKAADDEIIYAREYKNEVIVINGEDIQSYKDKKIVYEADKKAKYARLSINADILYNDRYSYSVSEEDLTGLNTGVTLIDNDSDGFFDALIIDKYSICIVDSIEPSDSEDNFINLKYPAEGRQKIKPDEIIDENSAETDIREIMQNDVLCVYESKSGDYVKAVVCGSRISGAAESIINEDDGNVSAVINGEAYRFSEECLKNQKNLINSRTNAVFILDVDNKIAYIDKLSDGFRFGYVINAANERKNLFLKLLTEDNEVTNLIVSENVVINGHKCKDKDEFWEIIGGKDYTHRLIQYRLDSDNEIKKINDADTDGQTEFFEKYYTDYELKDGIIQKKTDNEKHYYKSNSQIIANRVGVDSNTVIMVVPNDPSITDEKNFLTEDISYLIDDREYRVEAYRSSEDGFTADVILIYDDISSDYSISDQNIGISVLDKVYMTFNNDEELVEGLTVWDDGTKLSYPLKDDTILKSVYNGRTPSRGDIIRYSLRDGMINKLELIYSAADDTMAAPTSVTHKNDNNKYTQFRVWDAYVFYRWGTNLLLSDTYPTAYESFNYGDYYTHSCSASSIVVCEKAGKGRLYNGSMDNLIGYKNTLGAECSRVVLYERYGEGKTVVIYK